MIYYTRDCEAGNIIDMFESEQEAKEAIEKYEAVDKEDGTYTLDFYEVFTPVDIYDVDEYDLLAYCSSAEDAKRHITNKDYTVYTINDYINNLKNNELLEDDEEDLKTRLSKGSFNGDIDSGIYKGYDFVIEYEL